MATGRPNRRLLHRPPDDPIPQILSPPNCSPPPRPSPPPPRPFSDEYTTIRIHHSRSLLPALSVAAAFVVAVSAIMILITVLLIRLRRRAPSAQDDPVAGAAPLEDDDGDSDVDDGDGEAVVHHVWHIRTVGLDESAIESITAWAYKAGDDVLGSSATGCSVCLSEFRDGELVRLLPKCDHAFHLGCIDTWLRSHVNCPLCRAPILAPTSVDSAPALPSSSSSSLPPPESGVVLAGPNTVASADIDQMAGRQIDLRPVTSEEELEGERSELGAVPIPSAELQVPTDIGEDEFLPIRRSLSVNSISPALEEGLRNINNKKKQALEENSHARTTNRAKHARHASSFRKERGRSLASASERFVFSVHGRTRSSVFPQ